MKFIDWLRNKNKNSQEVQKIQLEPIEIGATYLLRRDNNPFPFEPLHKAVVLDSKKGFIQYRIDDGISLHVKNWSWSLPEDTFRYCYPTKLSFTEEGKRIDFY